MLSGSALALIAASSFGAIRIENGAVRDSFAVVHRRHHPLILRAAKRKRPARPADRGQRAFDQFKLS
jgi:hypothetical protein